MVGLFPFYATAAVLVYDAMPGWETPQFAGSAVAASDASGLATTTGGDEFAPTVLAANVAAPEAVVAAAIPAPDRVEGEAAKRSDAQTPAPAEAAQDDADGARLAGLPERTDAAETGAADERLAAAGDLTLAQPSWSGTTGTDATQDSDTVEGVARGEVPVPAPRPERYEIVMLDQNAPAPAEAGLEEDPVAQPTGIVPIPQPRPAAPVVPARFESAPVPVPARDGETLARVGAGGDARVVIHYPAGSADDAARDLGIAMDVGGVGAAELRQVDVSVDQPNVRYFHEQDRAAAESVNGMLRASGYRSEIKDFTQFSPLPSRGTVEVWIPG